MARITVQDCSQYVDHKFELIVLAILRTKDITSGAPITVKKDNDKEHVIALREIASGKIKVEDLKEELISRFQNFSLYTSRTNNAKQLQSDGNVESSLDFIDHEPDTKIEFVEEEINDIEDDNITANSEYGQS